MDTFTSPTKTLPHRGGHPARYRARQGWLPLCLVGLCLGGLGLVAPCSAVPANGPAGAPLPAVEGMDYLSGWQQGLRQADAEQDPLVIACFGDSNTEMPAYGGALRRMLASRYGDKGLGYVTLARNRAAQPGMPAVIRNGQWQDFDTSPGRDTPPPAPYFAVDGFWSETEDDTARVELQFAAGAPHSLRVHYRTGPGLGRFRVYAADWAAQTVECNAPQPGYGVTAPLTAEKFAIRDISGRVAIGGVDVQRSLFRAGHNLLPGGAQVHLLGNGWGQTSHLAPTSPLAWRGFMQAVRPDLITLMLGTNDMHNDGRPQKYRENLTQIVRDMRQAAPDSAILLLSCPEAEQTRPGAAEQYAGIAREVAANQQCGFWDWRSVVGERSRRFSQLGFMADGLHYGELGGEVLAATLLGQLGMGSAASRQWPALRPLDAPPAPPTLNLKRLAETPISGVMEALKSAPVYPVYAAERKAGELRFGVTAAALLVHALVLDGANGPESTPWKGTNVDLYLALPGKTGVKQLVLRPAGPGVPGQTSVHENGREVPGFAVPWEVRAAEGGGYHLLAAVPFAGLGLAPDTRELLLEAALVTAAGPGAPAIFSRWAGQQPDGGAFRDATHFARVTVP